MCIFVGNEQEVEVYRDFGDGGIAGCRCLSGLLVGATAL